MFLSVKSARSFVLIFVILGFWTNGVTAAETCFEALEKPESRSDVTKWSDLANWLPPTSTIRKAPGVVRFLNIEGGRGTVVNVDFYYVTFTPASGADLNATFLDLRLHFSKFAEGSDKYFGFGPYQSNSKDSDHLGASNATLWASDKPFGALMSFNLDTLFPFPYIHGAALVLGEAHGDVQVTCSSPTNFTFSTVESKSGGVHPVAGNRGFGLKANEDGTWMFYSKATDRESDSKLNVVPRTLTMAHQDNIFCRGHAFWLRFYSSLQTYLGNSGSTNIHFFSGNRGTVAYPLNFGAPVPVQETCSTD
jgi:hypothetical protein